MLWRLPFARSPVSWPPIDANAQREFPALHERFATADAIILPKFTEHDVAALTSQASHRRFQLWIILGATLTTVLGAVQAAADDVRWPGVVLALTGAATALIANRQRRSRPMLHYLTERAKAEELRSLYYRYLSGVDDDDRDDADGRELERKVAAIEFPLPNGPST
jgi:hypothetical protein